MKYTYFFLLSILPCLLAGCKDEAEAITIVQDITVTHDGEPYSVSARLLFIYDHAGRRVANYNPFERFFLENGTYQMFCATPVEAISSGWEEWIEIQPGVDGEEPEYDYLRGPYGLDELIWHQLPEAVDSLAISEVRSYTLPSQSNLAFDMITRTGKIRFVSLDNHAEPEITFDRVDFALTLPRTGYKISDGSYLDGTMEITRSAETTNGVGIREEFTVLPTPEGDTGISLTIRCFQNEELVLTLPWEAMIEVRAGQTTLLETYFQEPEEPEPEVSGPEEPVLETLDPQEADLIDPSNLK